MGGSGGGRSFFNVWFQRVWLEVQPSNETSEQAKEEVDLDSAASRSARTGAALSLDWTIFYNYMPVFDGIVSNVMTSQHVFQSRVQVENTASSKIVQGQGTLMHVSMLCSHAHASRSYQTWLDYEQFRSRTRSRPASSDWLRILSRDLDRDLDGCLSSSLSPCLYICGFLLSFTRDETVAEKLAELAERFDS